MKFSAAPHQPSYSRAVSMGGETCSGLVIFWTLNSLFQFLSAAKIAV